MLSRRAGLSATAGLSCLIIHTWRAGSAIRGSGGGAPSGSPGAELPVGGHGAKPPEADEVFVFKTLIFQCMCYEFA